MNGVDLEAASLEKARALARVIGESPAFRAFEAASEAMAADREIGRRLHAFQIRQERVRSAQAWGGADPLEEKALLEEWQALSELPTLRAYLQAQEDLKALFQDVARLISREVGIDYGAACSPAGGCC